MRALLYLRVSTTDQDSNNQRRELESVCEDRGWTIIDYIIEEQSAYSGKRPGYKKLLDRAHKNDYDILVTWSLDRLDRRGIYETLNTLKELDRAGVQFYSYQESYLSTLDEHTRELVTGILSWVAEMESKRRSERTKAGLERAREEGKQIGRPAKVDEEDKKQIRKYVKQKELSYQEAAEQTNLSKATISRIMNEEIEEKNKGG